ncbi:type II toxin-antitoxin system RelE/ParE family toxin [Flavobacterium sp.]|jgi:plasmid stabilization system protein ParE|uniref:type II toxin-antitoxin system RelE/ParE family toxin n=1 Tax=Flavobacterium sp. TaxID=239 RepID=UPI0037BE6989
MELEVYWTNFAEDKLTDIFEYYKYTAGLKVAQKLINGIIDESLKLGKSPFIGQKEELLKDRIQEYRYLVFKNYKIIYWIDGVNNKILVSHVFDTRQNPIKINLL